MRTLACACFSSASHDESADARSLPLLPRFLISPTDILGRSLMTLLKALDIAAF